MSIDRWPHTDGTVEEVLRYQTKAGPMYSIVFTYKVQGHWCGGTFKTLTPHRVGDRIPVQYDPDDPDTNAYGVRERRSRWLYIVFFTLLGLLSLYLLSQ